MNAAQYKSARRRLPNAARNLAAGSIAAAALSIGWAAAQTPPATDPAKRFELSADSGSAARLLDSSSDNSDAADDSGENRPSERRSAAERSAKDAQAPIRDTQPTQAKPAPKLRQPASESLSATLDQNRTSQRVEQITAEAVRFNGIQPGGSTRAELRENWGAPKEMKRSGDITRFTYTIEPFQQVVASVRGDRVYGIAIRLDKPLAAGQLAKQLRLDDCEPVTIDDSAGRPMGEVFPERGVMFAYSKTAGPNFVQQIVLEPIDAQAFLLSADARLDEMPTHALADADFAIELAPTLAVAHALRARALEALSRPMAARPAAEEASRLDPKNIEFRLLAARLQIATGDHQSAARGLQRILSQQPLPDGVEAQAYQLLGDSLAHPAHGDYAHAIEQHQQALRLADALARSASTADRRLARNLLVEAHLAAARDVALGDWSHKSQSAAKWLVRAKWLAEDTIVKGEADKLLLLRVYETGMLVLAAAPGKSPAAEWITGLERAGAELIDSATEAEYRGALEWRLALALADAVTIAEQAGDSTEALRLGEAAATLIAEAEATIDTPDRDIRVARLYYRLGAIEAIERGNHKAAVAWYDRATPVIETMLAAKTPINRGQHGDMLVSMAVSYWETGARENSVRLTQEGLGLLESAVKSGAMPRSALAVPYGNLSSMLNHQGDASLANHYAELASRCQVDIAGRNNNRLESGPVRR